MSGQDETVWKNAELIRKALEQYRTEPKDSTIRKSIDRIMQIHSKREQINCDKYYKRRHNILVLEYIIAEPMTRRQIMLKLGISVGYETYKRQIEKGIMELAEIMFGCCYMDTEE